MNKPLPIGKLDSDILKRAVFDNIIYKRAETVKRSAIGEDCAAVDFGELDCIMSTDPITASVSDIGRLSIHISCNDIATNGVQPVAILLAVMLPAGTTEAQVREIMRQAAEAAAACQVEIVGGHTEITEAVNKPVIVSTAIGRSPKGMLAGAETMEAGDLVYVTKKLGLEGTGIIASENGAKLLESGVLTEAELEEARNMLNAVSVVGEGVLAGRLGAARGMHDITEGGVLGAVWELCSIACRGAVLEEVKMPVAEVTKKLSAHYGINPLRLISSGSMLMIVSPEKSGLLEDEMKKAGIELTCIGRIGEKNAPLILQGADGSGAEITPPEADEVYKAV